MRAGLIGWMVLAGIGAAQAQTATGSPAAPPAGSSGPVVVMPVPTRGATPVQAAAAEMGSDLRPLLEAIAKATREGVDYQRVTPDLLSQILAKLDKIENKLDKVENAVKAGGKPTARR